MKPGPGTYDVREKVGSGVQAFTLGGQLKDHDENMIDALYDVSPGYRMLPVLVN